MKAKGLFAARSSSFFLPMVMMSTKQRQAMAALYAFCKRADDYADGSLSVEEKHQALNGLSTMIAQIYDGCYVAQEWQILAQAIQNFGLEQRYFQDMLEGMRMDVDGVMLRPSLVQLERYCYCVAGCVGLLSVPIMGDHSQQAQLFAIALGNALQLTNILRDVKKDAQMGRIYLPLEWLQEAGFEDVSVEQIAQNPQIIKPVLLRGYAQARTYYAQTNNSLIVSSSLKAALMMRAIYRLLLEEIRQGNFRYDQPYRLSQWKKIAACWRAFIFPDGSVL